MLSSFLVWRNEISNFWLYTFSLMYVKKRIYYQKINKVFFYIYICIKFIYFFKNKHTTCKTSWKFYKSNNIFKQTIILSFTKVYKTKNIICVKLFYINKPFLKKWMLITKQAENKHGT